MDTWAEAVFPDYLGAAVPDPIKVDQGSTLPSSIKPSRPLTSFPFLPECARHFFHQERWLKLKLLRHSTWFYAILNATQKDNYTVCEAGTHIADTQFAQRAYELPTPFYNHGVLFDGNVCARRWKEERLLSYNQVSPGLRDL